MLVYATTALSTDMPYWITREVLHKYFDWEDFLTREVRDVQSAYSNDWLDRSEDGRTLFYIPLVGTIGERTDLIGSRHRLAEILPHLLEVPIAIATAHLQPDAIRFIDTIPRRQMNTTELFLIPDFHFV